MKILVSFQPGNKHDNFEGARMRKTIKGALEMNDIKHTSNVVDYYDAAHFMRIEDEIKLAEAEYQNVPIIISSLYSEDDEAASFLEYKSNKGKFGYYQLKQKALKILNSADLVLVPTKEAKELLENSGVTTPIDVVLPGVNISRFNFYREDEKELFYRYFKEDKRKPLVLSMGEYKNLESIKTIIEAAKQSPNAAFYYFGCENNTYKFSWKLKKLIKSAPKNIHFNKIIAEDIYRSALMNAKAFVIPGIQPAGIISIEDAMAAKCQVIARSQEVFASFLVNGENAYIADFSETIASLVNDFLEGKIKPTTEKAFEEISSYTLKGYGEKLIKLYEREIQNKKGEINHD